jgi:hypothetical protein
MEYFSLCFHEMSGVLGADSCEFVEDSISLPTTPLHTHMSVLDAVALMFGAAS